MIAADTNHEQAENTRVSQSAAKIIEDIIVLGELHWQLLLDDTRQYSQQIVPLAGTVAAAAVLLMAAIGLGLAAVALKLVSEGISPAVSCGLVASVTIVIAAALLVWSRTRIRRMSGAFVRSRAEFAQNVAWIKTKL